MISRLLAPKIIPGDIFYYKVEITLLKEVLLKEFYKENKGGMEYESSPDYSP